MFPGLLLGSVCFAVYAAYDQFYIHYGPGLAEKQKWDSWMKERNHRLHGDKKDDHHH
jgi:hypothetical protein